VRALTPKPSSLHPRAWWVYLAAMTGLTTAYILGHFVGPHWLNSGPVYNVIGGSTVVALILGARKNSKDRRLPWYLFALGQAFFVTGDVLAYNYERFFGGALPFPSVADPFYLAFYPLLVAGLLLLIRERNETRNRASLIDALIITVAAAALSWVYLMAPYAHDPKLQLTTKLTSIAYPLMDILVLGVLLRMAVGSRRRGLAFGFLVAGTAALLLSDTIYGWKLLHGGYATGGILDVGWAIFYALLGAAALHPSMRQLAERAPDPGDRLTRPRLAQLTCATLTAPILLIARGSLAASADLYVLVATSVALFALVLLRMTGLVHRNEEAVRREAALRIGGEALVTAISREEIYAAALKAARSVVDEDVVARLYLTNGSEGQLTAVGCSDRDAASLPPVRLAELPATVRADLRERRVATVERAGRTWSIAPLFIREELTGVLSVLSPTRLKRAAEESLATLATEVALALHSAALTEQALNQRSEARLSSLVKNASDVICIVGADAGINYLSPSFQRMFGRPASALADGQLTDMVHPDERLRCSRLLPPSPHNLLPTPKRLSSVCVTPIRAGVTSRCSVRTFLGRRPSVASFSISATSPTASCLRPSSSIRRFMTRSRACRTERCSATASSTRWPRAAATACRSRSCSSTSTISRMSTTASGMPPATRCCKKLRVYSTAACGRSTRRHAWVAMSSPS
jgi:PAS domain-containing protein